MQGPGGEKANGRCVIKRCSNRSTRINLGEKDTSKHSYGAGRLAPRAQHLETHNSIPSAKWPRFRPRALRKDFRMAPAPVKLCVECGKVLTSMTGYVNSRRLKTGKLYLNSACKPCHNHRTEVVRRLKKLHPTLDLELFLDHCHVTDEFRD